MKELSTEEKDILLRDLCGRFPYGIICGWESDGFSDKGELTDICHQKTNADFKYWDGFLNFDGEDIPVELLKPYLRPMSSMTEEEKEELEHLSEEYFGRALDKQIQEALSSNKDESRILEYIASSVIVDWLNANHFDYRGLIPMGLAIAVTEDNNPYKN